MPALQPARPAAGQRPGALIRKVQAHAEGGDIQARNCFSISFSWSRYRHRRRVLGYGFGSLSPSRAGLYPVVPRRRDRRFRLLHPALGIQSAAPPRWNGSGASTIILMRPPSGSGSWRCLGSVTSSSRCLPPTPSARSCSSRAGTSRWRCPAAPRSFIYVLFDHWLYIDLPRGIFG